MNYSVTGHVDAAINSLFHAANACSHPDLGTPEAKLKQRIYAATRTLESIEKSAKKLIPGGFKAVPNAFEADKREQRERLGEPAQTRESNPQAERVDAEQSAGKSGGANPTGASHTSASRFAASAPSGAQSSAGPLLPGAARRALLRYSRQRRGG